MSTPPLSASPPPAPRADPHLDPAHPLAAAPATSSPGFPPELFDEPDPDPDTLAQLGPLRGLAGVWVAEHGADVKPTADGAETQAYIERYEAHPIDPQMNGPQLLYGLRYHTHIVKPGEVETYHDQVGYWLWEPATGTVMLTLTIPRAQAVLALGQAAPDARRFRLEALRGSTVNGIVSGPFLEANFRTDRFEITVEVDDDDHWHYDQTTQLQIRGVAEPFLHTDRCRLTRIGPPRPNPLMAAVEPDPRPAQPGERMAHVKASPT